MRKCLMNFIRFVECAAVKNCVNLVDLVKSFQTIFYMYILAIISFNQAENGPLKVCPKILVARS